MSPTLQQVIEGLARYAQLHSRVGFVHEFCALAEPEMRNLLLGGWQPPGVALRGRGFVSSMRKSLLGEGLLTPRSPQKRLPLRAKNKGFSACAEKTPPSNPSLKPLPVRA